MYRKRYTSVLIALFTVCAMLLGACGAEPVAPDVAPVTANVTEYVNTVEEFGNTVHSSVRIGDDGRFVLKDNYSAGTNEITGTWTLSEGTYTLKVESSKIGNYQTIIFEVKDDDTLILKTNLIGSKADQIFSSDPNAEMISLSADDDFRCGTYHNISSMGLYRSYIVIYQKGTFSHVDTDNVRSFVISGKWTHKDDRLICTYEEGGAQKTFDLQIRDDGILVLLNDVGESKTGNLFSMDVNEIDTTVNIPCQGIYLDNHKPDVKDNEPSWNVAARTIPEDTTDDMYFFSGNPSILDIDNAGNVTVYKAGDTYIKVMCGDAEITAYISVHESGPSDVLFNPGAERIDVGTGKQLNAIIIGGTGNEKVTYSSDDPSIATVSSSGYVTGVMPGQTRIVATLPNGLQGTCNVYINGEKATITVSDVTLKPGETIGLPIKAYYITNYDMRYNREDIWYELEFHTSDPSVLTVFQVSGLHASENVTQAMDVSFWFTWSDGSSLTAISPVYTAHIRP